MTRFAASAYVVVDAPTVEEAQERLRSLTVAEDRPVAIIAGVELFIDANDIEDVDPHGEEVSGA